MFFIDERGLPRPTAALLFFSNFGIAILDFDRYRTRRALVDGESHRHRFVPHMTARSRAIATSRRHHLYFFSLTSSLLFAFLVMTCDVICCVITWNHVITCDPTVGRSSDDATDDLARHRLNSSSTRALEGAFAQVMTSRRCTYVARPDARHFA
ncbi:MAG: hypothetical protein SFX73_14060 [Kofleriaceae bacterium]|nr:hypothetical protein [Kofleriaceae bacterium]